MWNKGDFIDIDALSRQDIETVLEYAQILEAYSGKGNKLDFCKGEILTTVFFEPSTRTEKSFEAAMHVLGGDVLVHHEAGSSREKGETKTDTLHVFEQYSDIVVIRDPEVGTMNMYADELQIPVINAGDGHNQHPTQTMLDMYTIKKEVGRLEDLKVVFLGDLKYGRTVHSLIKAMRMLGENEFFGVSPIGLSMPQPLTGSDFSEVSMEEIFNVKPDVIYATRIQKERMVIEDRDKYSYEINKDFLKRLPSHTKIMHPLPRVNEINIEVDKDPRFVPFRQVRNGLHTRMAIIALLLGHEDKIAALNK